MQAAAAAVRRFHTGPQHSAKRNGDLTGAVCCEGENLGETLVVNVI